VVANFYSYTVSVLLGNGNGTFGTRVDYGTGSGPRSVAIADLSGDGNCWSGNTMGSVAQQW
jgi:hypothetical protein